MKNQPADGRRFRSTRNIRKPGDVVNLNFKSFNKHCSGLIVKCLEIPHYAYSSR
jgi:hypothetical protein